MLTDEFEELLDVLGAGLIQCCVVDQDDDLLEIVVLFLPLKKSLCLLIVAEVLEEYEHSQMLEVALLYHTTQKMMNH